jgi:hypothetical protein
MTNHQPAENATYRRRAFACGLETQQTASCVSGERAFPPPGASTDLKPSYILESIAIPKAHKAEMGRPS